MFKGSLKNCGWETENQLGWLDLGKKKVCVLDDKQLQRIRVAGKSQRVEYGR